MIAARSFSPIASAPSTLTAASAVTVTLSFLLFTPGCAVGCWYSFGRGPEGGLAGRPAS